MSFKDVIKNDIKTVFLNDNEFARKCTVVYDGEEYENVSVVFERLSEQHVKSTSVMATRKNPHQEQLSNLYITTYKVMFDVSDLDGNVPEQMQRISFSDEDGYLKEYYISWNQIEEGLVTLGLEDYDE